MLKLLSFLGFLVLIVVFLNSLFIRENKETAKQSETSEVSINIESMYPGQIKKTRWKTKEVAVLYRKYPERLQNKSIEQVESHLHSSLQKTTRSQSLDYFVFVNVGDSKNCPLHYREGIFKDTCTASTFDEAGRATLSSKTQFLLEIPPHYINQNRIIFGDWKP